MYEAYFGLRSRPFPPVPRVESFIPLAPMREPLDLLIRCLEQDQGIGVLTAPAGTGKSLVCRLLHQHFSESRRSVLLTTGRFPTRRALLQAILFELKHPYVGLSEQEARLKILDLLQASPPPSDRMLLIVDEAHLLTARGLEELRTLTDYEVSGTPRVSLILAGQLELEELLTEPAMSALNQRVGCHVCLEPLSLEESCQYIRDRLRISGNDGLTIFTPEALHLISSASEGNPRRINQLCDHSLLLAFAEEQRPVDVAVVRSALLDLRELPLHWNAPVDLSDRSNRNPLEGFATEHEGDLADLDAEPPFFDEDSETRFDEELGSRPTAFEVGETHELDHTGGTVFEIGPSGHESPFDQLFQTQKFVVPGAFRHHEDESESTDTLNPLDVAHALSATSIKAERNQPAMNESFQQDDAHPISPTAVWETGMDLPPNTPKESIIEELLVDDTYAMIDRLSESRLPQQSRDVAIALKQKTSDQSAAIEPQHVVAHFEADDQNQGDLEDTFFDATELDTDDEQSPTLVPEGFHSPVVELPPVIMESQLLEMIREIDTEVRSYREENPQPASSQSVDGGGVPEKQSSDPPRHHSLRQALNWQFDVVEPDSNVSPSVPVNTECLCVSDTSRQMVPVECETSSEGKTAAITEGTESSRDAESPSGDRRYAQLFTRLQRQRRRVESVMNKERRTGAESHLS